MEYYAGANKPLETNKVLILIIMEDTHGEPTFASIKRLSLKVLILIIMEDTHGGEYHILGPLFTLKS